MKAIARFFGSVKNEMKKVRWPHRKEMIKLSIATIVIVCFFMLFFSASDAVISMIVKVFS